MMNSIPVVSSGCCTKAELVLGGGALPVRFSRTAAGAADAVCTGCCFAAVFVVVEVFAAVVPDALAASSFQRVRGFAALCMSCAAVFAADKRLRHKISKALNSDDIAEPNFFGVQGAIAAFTKGAAWLDALREYLSENRKFATEFIARELPQVRAVPQDATYLMWLDAGAYTQDSAELARFIREKTGLYLSCGAQYGKGGEKFLRLNIATSRALLKDGLGRLKEALKICPH